MTNNKKITLFNKKCICPLCGSNNVEETDAFPEGDFFYYGMGCLDCEATWREENELVFTENTNIKDKDGNEYISAQEANRLIEQKN